LIDVEVLAQSAILDKIKDLFEYIMPLKNTTLEDRIAKRIVSPNSMKMHSCAFVIHQTSASVLSVRGLDRALQCILHSSMRHKMHTIVYAGLLHETLQERKMLMRSLVFIVSRSSSHNTQVSIPSCMTCVRIHVLHSLVLLQMKMAVLCAEHLAGIRPRYMQATGRIRLPHRLSPQYH
jgi:hypothetical protein